MVTVASEYAVESRIESDLSEDVGRAITEALLVRKPATFTIEVDSLQEITRLGSPLRLFLLMAGRMTGDVSATVSRHFAEQTYPALLDLVGRLNESGARDIWKPDGSRSLAVDDARHMFISADMPVAEKSRRPNRLVEVVDAHSVSAEWYRTRVQPRLSGDALVKVFYGRRGVDGSAFASADAEAMADEAMSDQRRRFSLIGSNV